MSCLSFVGKTRHAHEIDTSTKRMIKHGFNKKGWHLICVLDGVSKACQEKRGREATVLSTLHKYPQYSSPPNKTPSKIVFIIEFQSKAAETQGS